jgi:glycosyltransferase involved in cell wall biosynthesis
VQPEPFFESCYPRAGLIPRQDVYRIGLWYWELEQVPARWAEIARSINEVWAPTQFIANALRKMLSTEVTTMLPGVKITNVPAISRTTLGIDRDAYMLLFMFDMKSNMERKNPLAAIEAYRKAFRSDDRVQLVIKVSDGKSNPTELARLKSAAQEAGVMVIDEVLSREASYGLIQECDCYVSLHRSEGLGLTLAEAMLMSKPVIATNYSGNVDFMEESTSMLVDYRLVPLRVASPPYEIGSLWAEASTDQAAHFMRWAFEHPDQAREMGGRAKLHAESVLSLEKAGERMRNRLDAIRRIWQAAPVTSLRRAA